jgi:hypothetical protein
LCVKNLIMDGDEQDDFDAACHQAQLEERRSWDAHMEALQAFRRWEQEMDKRWDEIFKLNFQDKAR